MLKRAALFIIAFEILCIKALKYSSLETSYRKGLDAHKGERWTECIQQFEESLHLYKLYKTLINNCRLKCNSQQFESQIENIEDLKIYEKFFVTKICLKKCQESAFEDTRLKNDVSDDTLYSLQTRQPFEYLHMCYFQMYNLPKAASATFTYLVANPEDEAMKKNLQYYADQPEVDVNEIIDLLSEDYMVLYDLGLKSYGKNNWGETVANMEEVITDYLSWENGCRAECERQPEQQWSPEITITISNNIASLLHCKQQCQDRLKLFGYTSGIEFLADILNYIQISYYHLDKINEAAKAVASYLLLLPQDELMLQNKKIYSNNVPEEAFVERMEIIYYLKRDKYEKQLLDIFNTEHNDNIDSNSLLI